MTSDSLELLCFQVGKRVFSMDIMGIQEILRNQTITPVPQAPSYVVGVLNLRGELIPVVDVYRALIGTTSPEEATETKVVVARCRGSKAAMLVDRVLEVVSVRLDELLPVPGSLPGQGSSLIAAFRRDLEGFTDPVVLLLRLDPLLRGEVFPVLPAEGQA